MKEKKVTVGIIFHNEQAYLDSCIKSLFSNENIDLIYQVILVDNNSSDNSAEIVSRWKNRYPEKILLIHSSKNLVGQARQLVLDHCQTDALLFTDGDCTLPKNWIKEHLEHFSLHPQSGGVCGPNRLPEAHPWQACVNLWMDSPIGNGSSPQALRPKKARQVDHLPTTNALFSVPALKKTDGFSTALMTGEDAQIGNQLTNLGYELWMYPTPTVTNNCANTFSEWLYRMLQFGNAQWTHSRTRSRIALLSLPISLLPITIFAIVAHVVFGLLLSLKQPLGMAFKTPAYGFLSLTFYGIGFIFGGIRRLKKFFS